MPYGTGGRIIKMENKKSFNEVLREIRLINDISQAEVARKSGLSEQMVSKIETVGYNITIDTLAKYCVALDIDINIKFIERGNKQEGELDCN